MQSFRSICRLEKKLWHFETFSFFWNTNSRNTDFPRTLIPQQIICNFFDPQLIQISLTNYQHLQTFEDDIHEKILQLNHNFHAVWGGFHTVLLIIRCLDQRRREFFNELRVFEGGVQNMRSSLQDDYVMSGSFCHGHVVIHVGYMFEYILYSNEINIHNSLECGIGTFSCCIFQHVQG